MQTADILIIGAGVAGLGVAAKLSPTAKVIVLEREDAPATHASGRSAATWIESYGPAPVNAASRASFDELAGPGVGAEGSALTRRGLLYVSRTEAGDGLLSAEIDAHGLQPFDATEAVMLSRILRPEGLRAAAFEPAAYGIDVDLVLSGYRRTLSDNGGDLVLRAQAQEITRDGDWRVTTPAGVFSAPVLVNAAGAWADVVAEIAGVAPLGLIPKRRSAALIPAPEGLDLRALPLIADIEETWYALPMGGALMVSPADAEPVAPMDAWAEDEVIARGLHAFQQAATVEVTRVTHTWAGLRTFTPDGTPAIGWAPEAQGFFWLAGQGGYGVQTAPAFSELAAALIGGGTGPLSADHRTALDPARFTD